MKASSTDSRLSLSMSASSPTKAATKKRAGLKPCNAARTPRPSQSRAEIGRRLDFSDLDIQPLGDSAAVVLGHWMLTDTPQAAHGVFSLVFTEEQGAWKILHDHSSAEQE